MEKRTDWRLFLLARGLKPERWRMEIKTDEYIVFKSVTGESRLFTKRRDKRDVEKGFES